MRQQCDGMWSLMTIEDLRPRVHLRMCSVDTSLNKEFYFLSMIFKIHLIMY